MNTFKWTRLLPVFAVTLLLSCGDETERQFNYEFEFNQIGMDGLKVYNLVVKYDKILASTNDGIYVRGLNSANSFSRIGLEGRNVIDFITLTEHHIIATTAHRGPIWDDPGLYETTDGGETWTKLPMFGIEEFEEPVFNLSVHPRPPMASAIFASGPQVIASSTDNGRTWTKVWGEYGSFATSTSVTEVNPEKLTDVWYGGQGGIENGYLGVMSSGSVLKEWSNLVPNPTVAVEIAFDKMVTQNIFVGFEGSLMKTSDNGNSWKEVINGRKDGMRFFYGIGLSDINASHVFAGGWLKGVEHQPLLLHYSTNSGSSWKTATLPTEQDGGIYSMQVVSEATRERIFVGLDKGGIYEIVAVKK